MKSNSYATKVNMRLDENGDTFICFTVFFVRYFSLNQRLTSFDEFWFLLSVSLFVFNFIFDAMMHVTNNSFTDAISVGSSAFNHIYFYQKTLCFSHSTDFNNLFKKKLINFWFLFDYLHNLSLMWLYMMTNLPPNNDTSSAFINIQQKITKKKQTDSYWACEDIQFHAWQMKILFTQVLDSIAVHPKIKIDAIVLLMMIIESFFN